MKHPRPDSIRTAMGKIRRAVLEAGGEACLDMHQPRIERDECGTTACFAGWYALAEAEHPTGIGLVQPTTWERAPTNIGSPVWLHYREWDEDGGETLGEVPFEDGASAFATDIGMSGMDSLEDWAARYPELWGNEDGAYMFSSVEAYPDCDTLGIRAVIAHWEAVADRIEAHNKGA